MPVTWSYIRLHELNFFGNIVIVFWTRLCQSEQVVVSLKSVSALVVST